MIKPGVYHRNLCREFLILNGWKQLFDSDEYEHFEKDDDSIRIDMNTEEIVFIDDSGDFLHLPTNYYTLIGVLLENRQLPFNYKSKY